jgi:hypothetical protein
MKLKEKIYDSITAMDNNELWFLYEQIQMLQHFKQLPPARISQIAIEDILEMTSSSPGSWSDTVEEERMERI